MYSIYDVKAQSYGVPFFSPTDGLAIRSFSQLCQDSNSTVFSYPEDFTLYRLGEIDLVTGEVSGNDRIVYVVSAVAVLNVAEAGEPADASPRD